MEFSKKSYTVLFHECGKCQAIMLENVIPAMIALACTYSLFLAKTSKKRVQRNKKKGIEIALHNEHSVNKPDLFTRFELPKDVILYICNFLHPRSITTLACVNRASYHLLDGSLSCLKENDRSPQNQNANRNTDSLPLDDISKALWRSLWFRDYGYVLLEWEVTRNAILNNSFAEEQKLCAIEGRYSTKELAYFLVNQVFDRMEKDNHDNRCMTFRNFYFVFQQTYINYVLAGKNNKQECFLGLHGHIFDFTEYAPNHPGLSDPIILECGRDVTDYFEDVRHSKVARKIGRRICQLVDRSSYTGGNHCGLFRPKLKSMLSCRSTASFPTPMTTNINSMNNTASQNSVWTLRDSNTYPPPFDMEEERVLRMDRILPSGRKRQHTTLKSIQERVQLTNKVAEKCAKMQVQQGIKRIGLSNDDDDDRKVFRKFWNYSSNKRIIALSDVRVFFDPFKNRWRAWYLDINWNPIFCDLVL